MEICLGIDASNIRAGGGLTHLCHLLDAACPQKSGIRRVVVFGGKSTLEKIPNREWLQKVHVPVLDRSLFFRLFWQQVMLHVHLLRHHCDALFSPGGSLPLRRSVPAITMSQNLLPFEAEESARFGVPSLMWLKMMMLRIVQSKSMKYADGVIFLTRYARDQVLSLLGRCPKHVIIIPHGIEQRFFLRPRNAFSASAFSVSQPFLILYVSIVDVYKHQWHVARAVAALRGRGLPVTIDFIGPAYFPALKRLQQTMKEIDSTGDFLH